MKWSPDLAIGIEHIDEQHQEWFKRADDLFEAGRERRAKEVIGELLEFLDDYTKSILRTKRGTCRKSVTPAMMPKSRHMKALLNASPNCAGIMTRRAAA